jgi:hypothetical protein
MKRRAALLNTSVLFSVLCAIGISLLVIGRLHKCLSTSSARSRGRGNFYHLGRALHRIAGIFSVGGANRNPSIRSLRVNGGQRELVSKY